MNLKINYEHFNFFRNPCEWDQSNDKCPVQPVCYKQDDGCGVSFAKLKKNTQVKI